MFKHIFKAVLKISNKRCIASSPVFLHRVTLIGSAGGVGKPLSMFLKANFRVTDLVLIDIKDPAGLAEDISHIDTFSGVKFFQGAEKMEESLKCSELVVVTAGAASTGKVTSEDIFNANKELIYNVASLKAKICPEAFLVIITNPINALVPLAAETLKQSNSYDQNKLFGVSNIDTVRSRTFIGDFLVIDPKKVTVNVIGGHSDKTIVPVLSTAYPTLPSDMEEWQYIYDRVRNGDNRVLTASGGKRSANLAISYAAAKFCDSLLKAMDDMSGITDIAFVETQIYPEVKFFSTKFDIKKAGIKGFHALPEMNSYEKDLLQKAIPELQKDIEAGIKYAQSQQKDKK